ncbi:MAG: ABC transporter substrate-binding protein, partial [Candidatus Limnocylindrales bacterium]
MKFARVGVALAAAAIVVTACGGSGGGAGKALKIGISLPLSGSALASAGPADKGARLAIKEFTLAGYTVAPDVKDHAVNGVHDPQQGAKDMTAFAADPTVVAVVGPFNSSVAKVQIPISNEAGLLQCSPANTNPDLTKGDAGKQLRAKQPDKINYVRVATTDDIQGPAVAQYGYQTL